MHLFSVVLFCHPLNRTRLFCSFSSHLSTSISALAAFPFISPQSQSSDCKFLYHRNLLVLGDVDWIIQSDTEIKTIYHMSVWGAETCGWKTLCFYVTHQDISTDRKKNHYLLSRLSLQQETAGFQRLLISINTLLSMKRQKNASENTALTWTFVTFMIKCVGF